MLADCRPSAGARYVWSYGADSGTFNGIDVDAFVKDLPIARLEADVLITYEISGAPVAGVRSVYLRADDMATWQPADLDPAPGREWQRFSVRWTPTKRGAVLLASMAEAVRGPLQPMSGYRNAIHKVPVNVV